MSQHQAAHRAAGRSQPWRTAADALLDDDDIEIHDDPDACKFMTVCTHKRSGRDVNQLFDTTEELNTFMQEHCPTAHLNYNRTDVYAMDLDGPAKLIERHQHFTGNVDYETQQFNEEAESRGLNEPRVATYSNVSSAVTAVAYFN